MKLKIDQRHFVFNEETLKSYNGIVDRTIDAKQKKPQVDFVMRVGYKTTAPMEILEGLTKDNRRLAEKDIKVVTGDLGPGDAWLSAMTDVIGYRSFYSNEENSKKHTYSKGCVTCLVDADQYEVNRSENLDGTENMAKSLLRDDLLLGLSSRDRVSLANTEKLDDARKIEEMFHAMFVKNIDVVKEPSNVDISNTPPSYLRWGDPIPGWYWINNSCSDFPELYKLLWEDSCKAKLTRLVGLGDTIGVMEASTLVGRIPSIGMATRENPPGAFKMDTIRRKSFELGKTGIGLEYFSTVNNKSNEEQLTKYYPKEDVKKVKEMILDGLKEGKKSKRTNIW